MSGDTPDEDSEKEDTNRSFVRDVVRSPVYFTTYLICAAAKQLKKAATRG
jgi:hypothetical protein